MFNLNPAAFKIAFIAIILALLYRPETTNKDVLHQGQHPRILLVTAHPDDECLFFGPTILSLQPSHPTESVKGDASTPEVYSICLSTGDADGLGDIRTSELAHSLDILGVKPDHRWVLNHPQLKDNITVTWDTSVIADVVRPYVEKHRITTILTFDYEGISGHPNHKSLPRGMRQLIKQLDMTAAAASVAPPRVYALLTVPLVTKYIGPFAAVLAKVDFRIARAFELLIMWLVEGLRLLGFKLPVSSAHSTVVPSRLPVFVSGIGEYTQALLAMRAHHSQLVWFRWLYVSFSRYMWVNEWVELR
ncbi:hypothetical protein HGRIS_011575 [Hohenbuehelia grisea]|uniref:N-acetylglucosaminylphosphatidylinositol deacetylase n=1 Tax=Hohenbuehelia grisea TaxID=104357 RepID=A0ABR3JWW3_9AGAR